MVHGVRVFSSWSIKEQAPDISTRIGAFHFRVVDPHDGDTLDQSVSLAGFSAAVEKLSCYKFNI